MRMDCVAAWVADTPGWNELRIFQEKSGFCQTGELSASSSPLVERIMRSESRNACIGLSEM